LPKGASAKDALISPNVVNEQDSTVTFTYIQKVFLAPAKRSFEEARGLVINDYQNQLEEKWLAQLRKKYPVVINEAVVKTL
jgi:peptidyl-prolyl cis-trans isomerase SurA